MNLETIVIIFYALSQITGTIYLALQVKELKKMIGNGEPGLFIRRTEVALMKEMADVEHEAFEKRLDKLEVWKESVKPTTAV